MLCTLATVTVCPAQTPMICQETQQRLPTQQWLFISSTTVQKQHSPQASPYSNNTPILSHLGVLVGRHVTLLAAVTAGELRS